MRDNQVLTTLNGAYHDKYCYPDGDVLINLLDLKNSNALAEAEIAFTAERYRTYQSELTRIEQFTFSHLQHLHYHLFQDLYHWAGQLREVEIVKGDTHFCTVPRIAIEGERLFGLIPDFAQIEEQEALIEHVADLFCEINLLHPFREGNGLVQRFFFEEMLFVLGYDLTWPELTQEQWVEANIAGVYLDLAPLKAIFRKAMSKR